MGPPDEAGALLSRHELPLPSLAGVLYFGIAGALAALATVGIFASDMIIGVIFPYAIAAVMAWLGWTAVAKKPRWIELHEQGLVFKRRGRIEFVPWPDVLGIARDYDRTTVATGEIVVQLRNRKELRFGGLLPEAVEAEKALVARLRLRNPVQQNVAE
jgi:hypothetical protein